ncbi:MAG: LacI family transcriptional regulator [Tepidanaerobacteraceae bacterium]|jgi:LacI family transcriptional regulator|nr:LacI family transcriptional regulator [Tepidanaerobacteraceae bacterium]
MAVTIKDIAREANVSITTVSRVINNKNEGVSKETKDKILQIMKRLNYRPNSVARSLVTKKTHTLGLILPDITNPFFPDLVRGVEDTANIYGYNIILCNTDDDIAKEKTYIKVLKEKCIDGIIYTSTIKSENQNVKMLLKYEIPFVMLDRLIDIKGVPYIYADGESGMYEIIRYLIENNHRRIAYISGPMTNHTAIQRFEGYKRAMAEAGLSPDGDLIMEGNYKMRSGYECMSEILKKKKKFTAVACANDLMAVGALECLRESGMKVPDDISVTGYDDIYVSNVVTPKLTTMAQPTYEMGCLAARILIKSIAEENHEKEVKLRPKLVIRESVAKI